MDQVQTPAVFNNITLADPGCEYWNSRSANARLKGKPSRIIPVSSVPELTDALQDTVNKNEHVAIRGGALPRKFCK